MRPASYQPETWLGLASGSRFDVNIFELENLFWPIKSQKTATA